MITVLTFVLKLFLADHGRQQQGSPEAIRNLFKRASVAHPDWPEKLFSEWILFERENGTLENFDQATERVQVQMELVEQRRTKVHSQFQSCLGNFDFCIFSFIVSFFDDQPGIRKRAGC